MKISLITRLLLCSTLAVGLAQPAFASDTTMFKIHNASSFIIGGGGSTTGCGEFVPGLPASVSAGGTSGTITFEYTPNCGAAGSGTITYGVGGAAANTCSWFIDAAGDAPVVSSQGSNTNCSVITNVTPVYTLQFELKGSAKKRIYVHRRPL